MFIRICEDKNLPLYHKLKDTITDLDKLHKELDALFRDADKRYNSGMFSDDYVIFDLNNSVIADMIKGLYYPQSPYLFSIIEPNMLGKIYEMFLTEQLTILDNGKIGLTQKKDCLNRSVVTTPTEIVKYIVEKTLSRLCNSKTPDEICKLRLADIACGSGVFLEEVFQYLQSYCVEWYLENDKSHLIEIDNGGYKLPLEEKKNLLCSCIYGVDITRNTSDCLLLLTALISRVQRVVRGSKKGGNVGSLYIIHVLFLYSHSYTTLRGGDLVCCSIKRVR